MRRLIEPQPHGRAKKVLAGTLAAATLAGAIAAAGVKISNESNSAITTTQSTNDNPSDDLNIMNDLFLDFDINDKVAVEKRAQDIYNISAKEIPVSDIINIIYLVNGAYKNINFGTATTDAQKYQFLQDLILKIEGLLGDNVPGYVNVLAGNQEKAKGEFVHAAYLISKKSDGKDLAIKFAQIVETIKESIVKGEKDKYQAATKDYLVIVNEVLKAIKDGKLTSGEATLITKAEKAMNPLVTTVLSKDSNYKNIVAELDKNLVSNTNKLGNEAVADLGLQAAVEELERDFKQTPVGDSYNASDAVQAQAMAGEASGKKVADEGGKDLGNESLNVSGGEVIGESTYTEVVNGGAESHEEQVVEGGDIVDEITYEEIVDLPPEVLEQIAGGVEIVEEGGDLVEEYFVDAEETTYVPTK